ncbi:class II fructose-bisphosphatase [Hyphomicrobiales bacterium 4NK60-0047b]|jgi:fructose-1,6-bisphosphatase II / sedoheptulose-1,7-bisphosphatase
MSEPLNQSLVWDVLRVTEVAAIEAAKLRGRGDEMAADKAAVDAMRSELNGLDIDGRVVIGEGERDEAPMLFIGEEIGTKKGPKVDIAVDPLEGTTLCAKSMPNSLAVLAMAEGGSLLHAPDIYMEKIAIGPGFEPGLVSLEQSPTENVKALANAKNVSVNDLTVCILDRSRHGKLIEEVREAGAAVKLIGDGDIAGVIQTTDSAETGIDMYMGVGGAPEGVLAASALRSIGGQMEGRLTPLHESHYERAAKVGIEDLSKIYSIADMVKGDVIFAATGVTTGQMLDGVRRDGDMIETETLIMHVSTGSVRWVKTQKQVNGEA